ncbi:cytochrome P450 [Penicillium frequentans]|nr:cytochrome P450 [Penicillium glabrum]
MRERQQFLLAVDGQDDDSIASSDLGLIWVSVTNVVPSAMMTALHIFADQGPLCRVRESLKDDITVTNEGADGKAVQLQIDMEKVIKNSLLQAIYAETLRLHVQAFVTRSSAHESATIDNWLLQQDEGPSAERLEMFDRLLLLQTGKPLYFGELGRSASTLIDYFTRSGARTLTEGKNPAEWLFEVTSSTELKPTNDWGDIWRTSPEAEALKCEIFMMENVQLPYSPEPRADHEYAASVLTQLCVVIYRMFQAYWRESTYL